MEFCIPSGSSSVPFTALNLSNMKLAYLIGYRVLSFNCTASELLEDVLKRDLFTAGLSSPEQNIYYYYKPETRRT